MKSLVPVLATVRPQSPLRRELGAVAHPGRRIVKPLNLRQDSIGIRVLCAKVIRETAPDRRNCHALPEVAPKTVTDQVSKGTAGQSVSRPTTEKQLARARFNNKPPIFIDIQLQQRRDRLQNYAPM